MATSIREVQDQALALLRGSAHADAWLHPRRRSTAERLFLEMSFLSVLFEHRRALVFDEVGDRLTFTLGRAAATALDAEDGERLLALLMSFNAQFIADEHPLSPHAALIAELIALHDPVAPAQVFLFSDDARLFTDHAASMLPRVLRETVREQATPAPDKHVFEYGRVIVFRGQESSEALFVRHNTAHALREVCLSAGRLTRELRMSQRLLLRKIARGKLVTLFDGEPPLRDAVVFMLQRAEDMRAHVSPEDPAARLLDLITKIPLVARDDVSRYCRDANVARGQLAALLAQSPEVDAPDDGERGGER